LIILISGKGEDKKTKQHRQNFETKAVLEKKKGWGKKAGTTHGA